MRTNLALATLPLMVALIPAAALGTSAGQPLRRRQRELSRAGIQATPQQRAERQRRNRRARLHYGGPALNQNGLGVPLGVSVDTSGNLWGSDNLYMRLLEFRPPLVNGMNASLVLGQPDFVTGTPGLGPSSLNGPFGAAFMP